MARKKDGAIRGHPKGTKNIMRSSKEKEQLVLDWQKTNMSMGTFAKSHGVSPRPFMNWVHIYEEHGLEGLKSKTGRCGSRNPYVTLYNKKNLTEVERLRLELAKKEVECERLKKGYSVKGVGRRKKYVTISKKNSK